MEIEIFAEFVYISVVSRGPRNISIYFDYIILTQQGRGLWGPAMQRCSHPWVKFIIYETCTKFPKMGPMILFISFHYENPKILKFLLGLLYSLHCSRRHLPFPLDTL